jgi:hypothetical protein
MGDGFVPPKDELLSPSYAKSANKLDLWRNFFENPTTVQFEHRVLVRRMCFVPPNCFSIHSLGYNHIHGYCRLVRIDVSSSSQAGTTNRHTKISVRIVRPCQPTSCTRHHDSPLPCSDTPRSRSSGRECRFTHSGPRVDGKPATAVGCRAGIEDCSQTPSYSIYPSGGEELTACNSILSSFSPLNGISVSRFPQGQRVAAVTFQRVCKSFFSHNSR